MSIEAMKQALEALESATPKYTRQRADQKTLGGALDYWKLEQHQRLKAITSLRQAIADFEKQEPVMGVEVKRIASGGFIGNVWWIHENLQEGVFHLYTHPQPKAEKQEPVGYVGWGVDVEWYGERPYAETDLYTHPQPKRELVGLTDEELKDIWVGFDTDINALKAVEAKLKEKNT